MTQGTQDFRFHVGEAKHSASSEMMGFNLAPYPFIRIQFRAIRWQKIQTQPSLKTLNFCRHLFRFMHGMAIQDQEYRPPASYHQAFQKAANHTGIESARFDHKTYLPPPIHRADQIQPMPRSRRAHHWGLSLRSPSRTGMVIAAHTRLISKPDLRPHFPGFLGNRRIFLLEPFLHSFRILLVCPPQGLLGSDTQLRQQTPHRIRTQADPIPAINQSPDCLTRPQGKWKFVLSGVPAYHNLVNPRDHCPCQQTRAAAPFAGIQCIPATGTIHRQPVINASSAESHRTHNIFGAFPTLHSGYCPLAQFRQHVMFQFAAIYLFHGHYYTMCILNVYTIMD